MKALPLHQPCAKLASAPTVEEAVERMATALAEFHGLPDSSHGGSRKAATLTLDSLKGKNDG